MKRELEMAVKARDAYEQSRRDIRFKQIYELRLDELCEKHPRISGT